MRKEGRKEGRKAAEPGTASSCKWPKTIPNLTDRQIQIKDEWMKYWHEVLPKKYGIVEKFNHGFPVETLKAIEEGTTIQTLEIGAGLGEHIEYENLDHQKYTALELRENMGDVIRKRFPSVTVAIDDIQGKTQFEGSSFDRIIAVHVLEHLPDLPSAISEIYRLLKDGGTFTAVIPCEGGMAYGFARLISANRMFKKKFNMPYGWLIKTEHLNQPFEIIEELEKLFAVDRNKYFPLLVPFVFCNLCIGLSMTKK